MTEVSLHAQAVEVELHFLGLRDLITRAESGKIKRPPFEIDRMRSRMAAAEAAARTLYEIDARRNVRKARGSAR